MKWGELSIVASLVCAACGGGSAPGDDAAAGGDSAGGSSGAGTGGAGTGGLASGGTNSGGSSGGSGGGGGTGGVVSPFDGYPDWVMSCSSSRIQAMCSTCFDAKCTFCLYASPEERETHNATHDSSNQCGDPDPGSCTICVWPVSGCPACAQQ